MEFGKPICNPCFGPFCVNFNLFLNYHFFLILGFRVNFSALFKIIIIIFWGVVFEFSSLFF
jgi:hypothetical protein